MMYEEMLARVQHADRQRDTPKNMYARQWVELRALDRLEARVRLTKQRLGMLQREAERVRTQEPALPHGFHSPVSGRP